MASTLACIELAADVYFACAAHAYSTEREEIMGLLIGETRVVCVAAQAVRSAAASVFRPDLKCCAAQGDAGLTITQVSHLTIISRVDKQRDRCEVSADQLVGASTQAEMLAATSGRPLRVLGWYVDAAAPSLPSTLPCFKKDC